MTLRGREVKPLEETCSQIIVNAKGKGYETKGPVRIPTKTLRITTRKSPCGEGTNTWDRFEMRIHKRVIDIMCPSSAVKNITDFNLNLNATSRKVADMTFETLSAFGVFIIHFYLST